MEHQRKTNVTSGIVLILIGSLFLAYQIFPSLNAWLGLFFTWPMMLVGIAGILLIVGILTRSPELAVPSCILAGIGGILYFQYAGTLTWESWAYLWTLIPGFAGMGNLIAGLFRRQREKILNGIESLAASVVLFAIFASIFGNMFGYFPLHAAVLPLILILVGTVLFIRALLAPRQ